MGDQSREHLLTDHNILMDDIWDDPDHQHNMIHKLEEPYTSHTHKGSGGGDG